MFHKQKILPLYIPDWHISIRMDGEIPPLSPILPLKTTVHVILMAHISIHLSLAKLDSSVVMVVEIHSEAGEF